MSKRNDGRDEAILEPDLPIVDTHHHLFDRPALHYMFDDYREDVTLGHRVVASVYVETLSMARPDGPELLRPLGEVEFANGVAAMSATRRYGPCRVAAAIVGHADLSLGEPIGELLDRCMHSAPDRFRGIRQITMEHESDAALRFLGTPPPRGLMARPGFAAGLRELANRGLSFDAAVFHTQLPALGALAESNPDLTIVLNHMGLAMAMDVGEFERGDIIRDWAVKLREVARFPNVMCKLGGLGTAYWGFGFNERPEPTGSLELAAAWQPFIETAVEAFGSDRCMVESNFPADGRSCGFVPLLNALKHVLRGCTPAEKAALFSGTAERVYRIAL